MKILKLKDVVEKVALSQATIYRKKKAGEFPDSISLGTRSVGWIESEIDKWITEQMLKRVSQ